MAYKWVALTNTTLASLLATLDASITIIAMPDIFRGIHLDPLAPANSAYLLWMLLGYLIVTSVLVVGFGSLGDLFGRVRMYTIGFATYTVASLLLAADWMSGPAGAKWLIGFRFAQGLGAAFLLGNSAAIVTDAFPDGQRGFALGINNVVGMSGQFIGLVVGGVLAPINWRLIFIVSVPFGLLGTLWSHYRLRESSVRREARIDWLGNVTFAIGLVLLMVGVTYGIRPYADEAMGWRSPVVVACLMAGAATLVLFVVIERRRVYAMFRLGLFRIRAFTCGVVAAFLSALARGGLMFVLIVWLQGIWLPTHGYSFAATPMWAGISMLPLSVGILVAGPLFGHLSDRYGSRPFASAGMLLVAVVFVLLAVLPTDFDYAVFALLLLAMGVATGAFASPNRASLMGSLPPTDRGAGAGMAMTSQNAAQVLSIGVFFSLLVIGLSATLPHALAHGLENHGVPASSAQHVSQLPPISVLFAAFLGYNPIEHLVPHDVLAGLTHTNFSLVTGHRFFPGLIAGPFRDGLHWAFAIAIAASLGAAAASWLSGGRELKPTLAEEVIPELL